jgi:hypothetical protein
MPRGMARVCACFASIRSFDVRWLRFRPEGGRRENILLIDQALGITLGTPCSDT